MKKILLLYGFWAWPARKGNWFHEEKVHLEKLGYQVTMPLPKSLASYFPSNRRWQKVIHDFNPDSNSVLIGFSLGGQAILDYLNESNADIKTVILMATSTEVINTADASSAAQPLVSKILFRILGYNKASYAWERIKKSVNKFVCIYKRDDPRVPYNHGVRLSRVLGAELITLEGRDHMWDIDLNIINDKL